MPRSNRAIQLESPFPSRYLYLPKTGSPYCHGTGTNITKMLTVFYLFQFQVIFHPLFPSQQAWNMSTLQIPNPTNLKALAAPNQNDAICGAEQEPFCCNLSKPSWKTRTCYYPPDASNRVSCIESCSTLGLAGACSPPDAVSYEDL